MLVTVSLLTLSITFLINGTKKLQCAVKPGEKLGKEVGGHFCLHVDRKFRCKQGAGVLLGNCQGSRTPPWVLSLPP